MSHSQRGFTLIEMAIVLILIGLLLGGVLKGQELITQGRIRNVQSDLDGIALAVMSYQDRYRALPGDDDQGSLRWNGAGNGNASGTLEGDFNATANTQESRILWNHLRRAGFLTGDGASFAQPGNALGGLSGVQQEIRSSSGNILLRGLVLCTTRLGAAVANALDARLDDGLPDRGSVLGFTETANDQPDFDNAPAAYVDDGQRRYTLCKTL